MWSVNKFSLLIVVHYMDSCKFYINFSPKPPFVAVHISMDSIIEERCWGEGKKNFGKNFLQAMTDTTVPIPQAQAMKLN